MITKKFTPRQTLNKAFLKMKPNRTEIDIFKKNLTHLFDQTNDKESEEFHKNLLADFLKNTYYKPNHSINTKERNDLVIHNGSTPQSTVGIIIEAKKPTNKAEMMTAERLNVKAFQELVLYYLRERITQKNVEIKHLIATNLYEWFVFDAQTFDRLFAQNKKLVQQFQDFEEERLADTKTDFFYKQVAEPFIAGLTEEIPFTHFNLKDYEAIARNTDTQDDYKLIELFKLFSPTHLLKLPFLNDSNSLDKKFYSELLHIIGLTEVEKEGKKLITRNEVGKRNTGSIIEETIVQLDSLGKIKRLESPQQFGENTEERLFHVGMELSITWINRILFLKLLEAQLISYHKGDKEYSFLNIAKIRNYSELNSLFFQVLARRQGERSQELQKAFGKVPYLNSSLFEPTELEHQTIVVSNLMPHKTIPVLNNTVLKDTQGNKRTGDLPTLAYLFEFLDAYDFGAEGAEEIQEKNKTLISASVLGLIFEKINGYKDGSFFTPGFITMYMCRETIRKAVIQKFNEAKNWDCQTIEDLKEYITNFIKNYPQGRKEARKEANQIINSLKICDPAVGSGHFLVSALNEIIAIKNDLTILEDRVGESLNRYDITVANDELVVLDEEQLFKYSPRSKESQRVQETLFHEKQTIIENCLFGVDINPNSVKICRLRLWIELLKNAYYLPDSNLTELETLPNIDINIKVGNSLISRFELDIDMSQALKKSEWSIESYQTAINTYRNAENKDEKREMERLIAHIKTDFRSEVAKNDPKLKRISKLKGEYERLRVQSALFQLSKAEIAEQQKQMGIVSKEIADLEERVKDIKTNKIYENAFEWCFEFPEVLDTEGKFLGFDMVIGNPPYMRVQEIQATQPAQKLYYELHYKNATSAYDLANIFFELAINLSHENSYNAFIFPHKFSNSASSETFRTYLMEGKYIDAMAHFGANMVFEDADTYTCVVQFSQKANEGFDFQRFPFKSDFKDLMLDQTRYTFITYKMLQQASAMYGGNQWIFFDSDTDFEVFEKIYQTDKKIADVFEGIFQGIATSKDDLYILNCIDEDMFTCKVPISGKEYNLERDLFKPFLMGKDVQRYSHLDTDKYVFFPYHLQNGSAEIVSLAKIAELYPDTYQYIQDHAKDFKARESGKAGKMEHWYAYIYPKNLNKFEQPKLSSMEICSNYPNVTLNNNKLYHTTKAYSWVKKEEATESYEYLLAIANSKILWWFLKLTGDTLQGDARTFKTNYLNPFPLPATVGKEAETKIVGKVKAVMQQKQQNPKADTTALEAEIDRLVYTLYGLTEEEIKVVEGA